MKLKGKLDLLFDRDLGLNICVKDDMSGTQFVNLTVSPEDVCALMSRQIHIDCDMNVRGLEKVGKVMWMAELSFQQNQHCLDANYGDKKKELAIYASLITPDPWVSDGYFGGQNSTFREDGIECARTTIRAYMEEGEEPEVNNSELPVGVRIRNVRSSERF